MGTVQTDFLCARPSFLEGMSRVLDLGNTLNTYNISSTPEEADKRAIANDFAMIGKDIKISIEEFQK